MNHDLMENLQKLHTTELGILRIRRNLALDTENIVIWCKQQIENAEKLERKGKNWYAYTGEAVITVNAHSYTIITAHRSKYREKQPGIQNEQPKG